MRARYQVPAAKSLADNAHGLTHSRNGADLQRKGVGIRKRGKVGELMCTLKGANMSAIRGCSDDVSQGEPIRRRNTTKHAPAAVPAAIVHCRRSRQL